MIDKKHMKILISVIVVVLVVAGVVTYSMVAHGQPGTGETITTSKSFLPGKSLPDETNKTSENFSSDKSFPDETTTAKEERTLPMITVA